MWEASSRRSSMDGGKMCHAAFCQKSSKFCDHLKPNRQTMKVQRVESRKDSRCDASSRWRDRTQAWNVLKKSSHSSWDVLWAGCEAGHSTCVPGCLGVVTESFCVSDRSPAEIKTQQNNIGVIRDVWWAPLHAPDNSSICCCGNFTSKMLKSVKEVYTPDFNTLTELQQYLVGLCLLFLWNYTCERRNQSVHPFI